MKDSEIQRYLKQTDWWHGTTLSAWKNIQSIGIKADYNEGTELDFGYGFYITPKQKQAEYYIKRVLKNNQNDISVLLHCQLCLKDIINQGYSGIIMPHHNAQWADFVFNCRLNPLINYHSYDFVLGATADYSPVKMMAEYRVGLLTKTQVISNFINHAASTDQLVIHNQEICDKIDIIEVIDANTGRRLDLYE